MKPKKKFGFKTKPKERVLKPVSSDEPKEIQSSIDFITQEMNLGYTISNLENQRHQLKRDEIQYVSGVDSGIDLIVKSCSSAIIDLTSADIIINTLNIVQCEKIIVIVKPIKGSCFIDNVTNSIISISCHQVYKFSLCLDLLYSFECIPVAVLTFISMFIGKL